MAATCPVKDKGSYPLCHPVVGSAELSVVSNHQLIELPSLDLCVKGVNGEHGCPSAGVDGIKADNAILNALNEGDLDTSGESVVTGIDNAPQVDELISKFWEVEVSDTEPQVADVQGRLKQNLPFWREVLQAPPWVIDCIENGYCLPLKYLPPPYSQSNHK